MTEPRDLNRSVIKSDYASIFIPELDLEIPSKTQRGTINTIGKSIKRMYTYVPKLLAISAGAYVPYLAAPCRGRVCSHD